MSILIIGNILKDVYLRLDERKNHFETDEKNTPWLDLAFDGSSYNFFRRTSIYGGAAVSLEVLNRFGLEAQILGARLNFQNGEVVPNDQVAAGYRYILCHDDQIAYLTPDRHEDTPWEAPLSPVDWVFIDRSAGITKSFVKELKRFLSMSSHTRIAFYASNVPSDAERELAELAELVFIDENTRLDTKGSVCEIAVDKISIGGLVETFVTDRVGLMTDLTLKSIAAASVFAALLKGKTLHEAVVLAKLNIENSSLSGTLNLEKLETLARDCCDDATSLIARQLMTRGKGILAADESGGSIHKKFEAAGIPDDESHRRDYRNILFSTPELEKYVSGVILFDETTRQLSDDGRNFVAYLTARGIIPGVKVDGGLENFPNSEEKYTKGLDGLTERLVEYYRHGLRFAKWRAAFEITADTPSDFAIRENAKILARYAGACQKAGLVPIVEPEVVYDGDYPLEVCAETTGKVLDAVFAALAEERVCFDACLLKCNMVLAGKKYPIASTPEEVGRATAEVLRAHVPENLAGVVFLSGGQSVEQATNNLRACIENGPYPWPLTFSFSRALQNPALEAWAGDNANADQAQTALISRLTKNVAALELKDKM